jgi:hypothetical protein
MAHSSGASRLALPQRAAQPGGGGVLAAAAPLPLSAGAAAGGVGAVCADLGGALDFAGCCAPMGPARAVTASAVMRIAGVAEFFIAKFINLKIGQQIGQVSLVVKNNLYQSMA